MHVQREREIGGVYEKKKTNGVASPKRSGGEVETQSARSKTREIETLYDHHLLVYIYTSTIERKKKKKKKQQ